MKIRMVWIWVISPWQFHKIAAHFFFCNVFICSACVSGSLESHLLLTCLKDVWGTGFKYWGNWDLGRLVHTGSGRVKIQVQVSLSLEPSVLRVASLCLATCNSPRASDSMLQYSLQQLCVLTGPRHHREALIYIQDHGLSIIEDILLPRYQECLVVSELGLSGDFSQIKLFLWLATIIFQWQ